MNNQPQSTENDATVESILRRHLGDCGRLGLPCRDTLPREQWCGRCDLVACVLRDLEPHLAQASCGICHGDRGWYGGHGAWEPCSVCDPTFPPGVES